MTRQQEHLFVLFTKHLVDTGWEPHKTSEVEAVAAGVIEECWDDYAPLCDVAALTLLLKHIRLTYKGYDVLTAHREDSQADVFTIFKVLLRAHYQQSLKIAAKIWG